MPGPVLVVADMNALRRRDVARRCAARTGSHALEAASFTEVIRLLGLHKPGAVAIATELIADQDPVLLRDAAKQSGTRVILFGPSPPTRLASAVEHVQDVEQLVLLLIRTFGGPDPRRNLLASGNRRSLLMTAKDQDPQLICIGASTGGVSALETVLLNFPADCPPTLIVQHIRPGFAEGLVRRLNQLVNPHVIAAKDSDLIEHGKVYVAAAHDLHLGLTLRSGLRLRLLAEEPVSGHRPSVDVLFHQAAAQAKRIRINAALLTGMGADGADGMAALRAAGAYTIAQDENSSVVWGMPRVAIERGGAIEVLALDKIGPALLRQVAHGRFAPL